jgi:hypothetical protein
MVLRKAAQVNFIMFQRSGSRGAIYRFIQLVQRPRELYQSDLKALSKMLNFAIVVLFRQAQSSTLLSLCGCEK